MGCGTSSGKSNQNCDSTTFAALDTSADEGSPSTFRPPPPCELTVHRHDGFATVVHASTHRRSAPSRARQATDVTALIPVVPTSAGVRYPYVDANGVVHHNIASLSASHFS